MELTYTKVGDYYIPDLALGDDAECEIGTEVLRGASPGYLYQLAPDWKAMEAPCRY